MLATRGLDQGYTDGGDTTILITKMPLGDTQIASKMKPKFVTRLLPPAPLTKYTTLLLCTKVKDPSLLAGVAPVSPLGEITATYTSNTHRAQVK